MSLIDNIPNLLTYFRLAIVPFFLMCFLTGHQLIALILFFVAGATDLVDGYLARRLDLRSKIGAILDPIADKCLMAATFICLAVTGKVPWWFVILMLAKDLFIMSGIAFFCLKKIEFRYEAIFWSKATTLMLILIGLFGLIDLVFPASAIYVYPVGDFVFGGVYITAVLIGVTILDYLRTGLEILHTR